jgi:hypothetical protein
LVRAKARARRGVQIYATYTQKRDVTRRLESVLSKAGIKAAVLTTQTPPEEREAWYERHLRAGVQAFIGHPRLVQTGLDYVEYEPPRRGALSLDTSALFADLRSRRVREPTGSVQVGKCGFRWLEVRVVADRNPSPLRWINRPRCPPTVAGSIVCSGHTISDATDCITREGPLPMV